MGLFPMNIGSGSTTDFTTKTGSTTLYSPGNTSITAPTVEGKTCVFGAITSARVYSNQGNVDAYNFYSASVSGSYSNGKLTCYYTTSRNGGAFAYADISYIFYYV